MSNERENLIGRQSLKGVILPSNLPDLLQKLSREDLSLLSKFVSEEVALRSMASKAERGGTLSSPLSVEQNGKPGKSEKFRGDSSAHLKRGQINAIKASFSAGMKVSTIARQFGIPQSDIKTVLSR